MKILAGLTGLQKYAIIGLAAALTASIAANGFLTSAWLGARDATASAIEKCNTDKAKSVAEAERMVREAEKEAAAEREAALRAKIAREAATAAQERQKRADAEAATAERDKELERLAQEAFDEEDLPDSNAALNVYLTSHALRCVLQWSRDSGEAGAGGGGEEGVCGDPAGADGVHPGFSNVTFGDALRYWGADRSAAIRLNQRMAEIRRIQGEQVNGLDED